jgi:hypothetical protein
MTVYLAFKAEFLHLGVTLKILTGKSTNIKPFTACSTVNCFSCPGYLITPGGSIFHLKGKDGAVP